MSFNTIYTPEQLQPYCNEENIQIMLAGRWYKGTITKLTDNLVYFDHTHIDASGIYMWEMSILISQIQAIVKIIGVATNSLKISR